jgi:hypothetical protein
MENQQKAKLYALRNRVMTAVPRPPKSALKRKPTKPVKKVQIVEPEKKENVRPNTAKPVITSLSLKKKEVKKKSAQPISILNYCVK